MERKDYLNAFMNNSATIRGVLKEETADAPHKAVMFDTDGKLKATAADGDAAVGLILSDAPADLSGKTPAGTEVDVLIKNIGLGIAGEAVKAGDLLMASTGGKLKKATDGKFVFGQAMTAAGADGELVQVQITKGGYAANPA